MISCASAEEMATAAMRRNNAMRFILLCNCDLTVQNYALFLVWPKCFLYFFAFIFLGSPNEYFEIDETISPEVLEMIVGFVKKIEK